MAERASQHWDVESHVPERDDSNGRCTPVLSMGKFLISLGVFLVTTYFDWFESYPDYKKVFFPSSYPANAYLGVKTAWLVVSLVLLAVGLWYKSCSSKRGHSPIEQKILFLYSEIFSVLFSAAASYWSTALLFKVRAADDGGENLAGAVQSNYVTLAGLCWATFCLYRNCSQWSALAADARTYLERQIRELATLLYDTEEGQDRQQKGVAFEKVRAAKDAVETFRWWKPLARALMLNVVNLLCAFASLAGSLYIVNQSLSGEKA